MYYTPDQQHGLPFDPFKAIVAPRPIGWIATCDAEGRPNLAPYSYFNAVGCNPHMIAFSSEGLKHSARNCRDTREFTFSLATLTLAKQVNASSASLADGENEFQFARLTMAQSRSVKPPFVAESPAALECKVVHFIELADIDGNPAKKFLTVGQVVGTHIKDEFIVDGHFDAVKAQTIARCGYDDYATLAHLWQMARP